MSKRDYSSFASAAKSRFRDVAKAVGFEQITGVMYAREQAGWHEVFALQASQYGSETFYVNFGICVTRLFPTEVAQDIRDGGLLLWGRLANVDGTGAFTATSKADMEQSAERVLVQLRKVALPWFARRNAWDDIATHYYEVNPIEEEKIGRHSIVYGADLRSATYGGLLLKAGRLEDARRWLQEAKRLLSLPVYFTRDGRTVHVMEKFARLQKRDPSEVELLRNVCATLDLIESAEPGPR